MNTPALSTDSIRHKTPADMIIRLVGYKDATSEAIRIGQGGGWATHGEVLMPDGTLLGSVAPDTAQLFEGAFGYAVPPGVAKRPRDYDKGQFFKELFVTLRPTHSFNVATAGSPEAMAAAFHDYLEAQIGKPYDFKAVAGIALERDWRSEGEWFCTELVAVALEKCGYFPRLYVPSFHVSPRDLLLALSGREYIEDARIAA